MRREFQLTVDRQLYDRVAAIGRDDHRSSVPEQMVAMLSKAAAQWRKLAVQAVITPLPAPVAIESVPVRLNFSQEEFQQIERLARQDRRSPTKQIVFMLELAVEHWPELSGHKKWPDPPLTDIRRAPAMVPTA